MRRIINKLRILCKEQTFWFFAVFVVFNLFFTRQIFNNNGISVKIFLLVAIIEVAIEVGVGAAVFKMRKSGKPLEKQFLLTAIVLGIMFILILPPGQAPDEIMHFRRAYGISQGVFIAEPVVNDDGKGAAGSQIPQGSDVLDRAPEHGTYTFLMEEITHKSDEVSEQTYANTALYNFICYIPQVLAALIGNFLNFSVLATAYLMSIFNFLVWLVLTYYAIKMLPKFKSIALFVLLLPITIQEATSLSPDALTIGLSLFTVSYILHLAYERATTISKKEYIILSLCALVIGFCKIVYLPLVFLMFVIPYEKFGNKRKKWVFLGCLIGLVVALNLIWLKISSRYLIEYNPGVDSGAQLAGIIKNPLKYLMTIFRTINVNSNFWMTSLTGMTLGWFNFNLPYGLFFVTFSIMVILMAQRDETLKMGKRDRVLFCLVFVMVFVAIMTSLYLQWTAAGAEVIDGVQGRYFLPIMILIPVIICRKDSRKKYPTIISERMVLCYSMFLNIVACATIFAQNI